MKKQIVQKASSILVLLASMIPAFSQNNFSGTNGLEHRYTLSTSGSSIAITDKEPSVQRVLMTVTGIRQGAFTGKNNATQIEIIKLDLDITTNIRSIPSRDPSTSGYAGGKSQPLQLTMEKLTDASTSQFISAINAAEYLTIKIDVYNTPGTPLDAPDFSLAMTEVMVSSFSQRFSSEKGFVDSFKMTSKSTSLTVGNKTVVY